MKNITGLAGLTGRILIGGYYFLFVLIISGIEHVRMQFGAYNYSRQRKKSVAASTELITS